MERQSLLEQVHRLRQEGKSIRTIAVLLSVHPSKVQRALKSLIQSVTPSNQRSSPSPSRDGVFVGRQREMGALTSALNDSLSGSGGIVMIAGEPGIGKTRTARELSAYAVQQGAKLLSGRCYEEQGMPPYWPWAQVMRSYLRGTDPVQLRSEMGAGAASLAEVLPEVKDHLPDLQPPPALDPQQSRFRLFDSIATFLMRASQAQPQMLVLDNLHWADRSSLLLLEFLAQDLADRRLLVVGTYRDTELTGRHPLSSTLGELARHSHFSRVILRGLGRAGVGSFIQSEAGDFDAGETYLDRLLESIHWSQPEPSTPATMATPWCAAPAVVITAVAHITGVANLFDVAEAIAQRAVSSPFVQLGVRNAARMALAIMAVQRSDAVASKELYAALVSMRGTMFPQCPWGHALAADRILGLLSQTLGEPEQVKTHFEDALFFCRKAGYLPELAWTCHDYAKALLIGAGGRPSLPGDREKARSLLDGALAISTELGMRPLMEKVTARRECLEVQPPVLMKHPANMTERQWEVLSLLAQGMTNREIAHALVLSERTVQRHIADIYDKIGARNRSEATAFAMSQPHPEV